MHASVVAQRLSQMAADRDRPACMLQMSMIVHDRTLSYDDGSRAKVVEAILTAVKTFPRDAALVGGGFCALVHASGACTHVSVPIDTILDAAKPHESVSIVVGAAARLVNGHVASHVHDQMPRVAESVARWIGLHPEDETISYYCGNILIRMNAIDPEDVVKEHGEHAVIALKIATVTAATASRVSGNVTVNGMAWSTFLLDQIHPRRWRHDGGGGDFEKAFCTQPFLRTRSVFIMKALSCKIR